MRFTYTFDQLRETDDNIYRRFMDYDYTVDRFGSVDQSRYFTADYRTVEVASEIAACEKLFTMYNTGEVRGYTGRGMSVSDIVNLWDYNTEPSVKTVWFCDKIGFIRLED